MEIPFFNSLKSARRVLLAGAGGGFDVMSALPLYTYLRNTGRTPVLANLSFSRLDELCRKTIAPTAWLIDRDSALSTYFPERHLVDWLEARGEPGQVIGFGVTGVRPLREAYAAVVAKYDIDTIVLVDGGTDSLIKGDEALLATIEEDATSIVAVNEIAGPRKLLVCLGFGIDSYHGVCHHSFLENTSEMIRSGGYLGCVSITRDMPEGKTFLDAVEYLNKAQTIQKSIVCNSIASAMRGEFGDVQATGRTVETELFINPLMTVYWCYDVPTFAKHIGFYEAIRTTETLRDVNVAINLYHANATQREWKNLPL